MKHLILCAGLVLSIATSGQTYFYIDNISVDPVAPTTSDNISIDLTGNLSSSGSYVAFTSANIVGNIVTLTVNSASTGGLAVLVPHTETIAIGQLAAGTYTIAITGTATGDFAPQPEHSFNVTGGGNLPACDSLIFYSIQYAAYYDSIIEVTVSNPSSVLFDYPGFILFDDNGDTLAIETVNYFGIGQFPQIHSLFVHPGATLPSGPFTGTLELWTSFYTNLSCTFPITDDLCPPGPCSNAVVFIGNTGGAFVVSSFPWAITDSLGISVASGQLQLGNAQTDTANVCLPPGTYVLTMTQPNISGGQLFYGMGNGTGPIVQDTFIQGSTNQMTFQFYANCVDDGTAIAPAPMAAALMIAVDNGMLSVRSNAGLGLLRILDLQGRVVLEELVAGYNGVLDVHQLASGCYVLAPASGSVRGLRFVKP